LGHPSKFQRVSRLGSVMEFGCDQLRAGSSYLDMSQTGSKPNSITLSGRRQVRSWSRTCRRPANSC